MKIRYAHTLDVALCDDESCPLLHINLADENNKVFAAIALDADEWPGQFINALIEVAFHARLRQRAHLVKH